MSKELSVEGVIEKLTDDFKNEIDEYFKSLPILSRRQNLKLWKYQRSFKMLRKLTLIRGIMNEANYRWKL